MNAEEAHTVYGWEDVTHIFHANAIKTEVFILGSSKLCSNYN